MTPFWVCLRTVTWQGMQITCLYICAFNSVFVTEDLACSVSSCLQIWSSVLAVWARSCAELNLGMFGAHVWAAMFSSSTLSFLLFLACYWNSVFAMRQKDFELFMHPFVFEKFPDEEGSLKVEARCMENRAATLAASFSCEVVNLLHIRNSEICQGKNHLNNWILSVAELLWPLLHPSTTSWCSTCTPSWDMNVLSHFICRITQPNPKGNAFSSFNTV